MKNLAGLSQFGATTSFSLFFAAPPVSYYLVQWAIIPGAQFGFDLFPMLPKVFGRLLNVHSINSGRAVIGFHRLSLGTRLVLHYGCCHYLRSISFHTTSPCPCRAHWRRREAASP